MTAGKERTVDDVLEDLEHCARAGFGMADVMARNVRAAGCTTVEHATRVIDETRDRMFPRPSLTLGPAHRTHETDPEGLP